MGAGAMKRFVPPPGAASNLDPSKCIKPIVVTDTNLADYESMPFSVQMLTRSSLALSESPVVYKATIMLYAESWHQVPPGSLPNDDLALAILCGLGNDYPALKSKVMRDWFLCSDNRLYNYTVAARVNKGLDHKQEKNKVREGWSYKRRRTRSKVEALHQICRVYEVPFDASKDSVTYLTNLLDKALDNASVIYQPVLNDIHAQFEDEVAAEKQAKQLQQSLQMSLVSDGAEFASMDGADSVEDAPQTDGSASQLGAAASAQPDEPSVQTGQPALAVPQPTPPSYVLSTPDGQKDVLGALDGISASIQTTAPSQPEAATADQADADAGVTESYKWGDVSGSESYKYPEVKKQESYKSSNEPVLASESYKDPKTTISESYKAPILEIENHKNKLSVADPDESSNFMILTPQRAEKQAEDGSFDPEVDFHKNTPNEKKPQNTHETGIYMISPNEQNHKNTENSVVFTPKSEMSKGTSPRCPRTNIEETQPSSEISPSSEQSVSVLPKGKGSSPPSPNPTPPLSLNPARAGESMDVGKDTASSKGVMGTVGSEPAAAAPLVTAEVTAEGSDKAEKADKTKKPRASRAKTGYNPFTHPVPGWMPLEPWNEWLTMRQAVPGKEVRTPATIKRSIELLEKMHSEGYDVEATILKSVRQQWTDFYRKDEHKLGAGVQQTAMSQGQAARSPTGSGAVSPRYGAPPTPATSAPRGQSVPVDNSRLTPPGALQQPPGLVAPSVSDGQAFPAWAHPLLANCEDEPKRLVDLKRHIEVYAKDNRVPAGIALQRYPFVPREKEVRISIDSLVDASAMKTVAPGVQPGVSP